MIKKINNKTIGNFGITLTIVIAFALFVYVAITLARYEIWCCVGAEYIRISDGESLIMKDLTPKSLITLFLGVYT